jgi:hypothetical protein
MDTLGGGQFALGGADGLPASATVALSVPSTAALPGAAPSLPLVTPWLPQPTLPPALTVALPPAGTLPQAPQPAEHPVMPAESPEASGPGAPLPRKPGLEHAYAYACFQDPQAYQFATELLDKVDRVLKKMAGSSEARAPGEGTSWCYRTPEERYVAAYGNDEPSAELGSAGLNATRMQEIIAARHPSGGVELREKISLVYEVMEWFPHELHRIAGIKTFETEAQWREWVASTPRADRETRRQTLARYITTLDLGFQVSIDHLAEFGYLRMASPFIEDFYHGSTPADHWRGTNTLHFEPREDLLRSPWIPKPGALGPQPLDVVRHDPGYAEARAAGALDEYQPTFETIESDALNGSTYYAVRDGWFDRQWGTATMMTYTGPAGTVDNFIRLMQIFCMPLPAKVAGVKALIGPLHLDDHHSIHEGMVALAGDPELDARVRYDGTPEALRRLDENTYREAEALQDAMLAREIAARNRHQANKQAVWPDDPIPMSSAGMAEEPPEPRPAGRPRPWHQPATGPQTLPTSAIFREATRVGHRPSPARDAQPVRGAEQAAAFGRERRIGAGLDRVGNAMPAASASPTPTPPRQPATNEACQWLEKRLEDLSPAERQRLDEVLRETVLVVKGDAEWIDELVSEFPSTGLRPGSSSRIDRPFPSFEGVSASYVPPVPFVSTFNGGHGREKFYGVILNEGVMVPTVAGHQDLHSYSRYESEFFSRSRTVGSVSGEYVYNGFPVVNISPDGEACHDLPLTKKKMVQDMLADRPENLYFDRARHVLTHNELVLGRSDDHQPSCKGMFVDLTSNIFVFDMAEGHYPHLFPLSKLVPLSMWQQAQQAMNVDVLTARQEEFLEMKALCQANALPFYMRVFSPETGQAELRRVDLDGVDSIDQLARAQGLPKASQYPILTRILDWLRRALL